MPLIFSAFSFGQNPDDKIDIFNFNQSYFEQLVKNGIDSVRESYRLHAFVFDSSCYQAALDQVFYLVDDTSFNHFRKDPVLGTPEKRYRFYGGKEAEVSENLAKIFINRITTYSRGGHPSENLLISTYRQASDFIISAWIESSKHFSSIVSPAFTYTGVAALFNEEDNSLICAQVFAGPDHAGYVNNNTIEYSKNNNSGFIENPWGVFYPEPGRIKSRFMQEYSSGMSLIITGNEIFLDPGDNPKWTDFFIEKNDGIATQLISISKYDCRGDEESRDAQKPSEWITKPVYRQQLIRQFNRKDSVKLQIGLGPVPEGFTAPFEINILILKQDTVAEIIRTNHLCGKRNELKTDIPLIRPDTGKYGKNGTDDQLTNEQALNSYKEQFEYLKEIYPYVSNRSVIMEVIDRIDSIQSVLFKRYLEGKISFAVIDSLPDNITGNIYFPEKNYYNAAYNKQLFKYFYLPHDSDTSELLKVSEKLNRSENRFPEATYNYYALLIRSGSASDELNRETFEKTLFDLKNRLDSAYYVKLCHFYYSRILFENNGTEKPETVQEAVRFLNDYYLSDHSATAGERISAAKLLIFYKENEYAFSVLSPLVDSLFTNKEACILDLMLFYSGKISSVSYSDYYNKLIRASDYLSDEEWLDLFEGSCRLNLQLLDFDFLCKIYCSKKRKMGG